MITNIQAHKQNKTKHKQTHTTMLTFCVLQGLYTHGGDSYSATNSEEAQKFAAAEAKVIIEYDSLPFPDAQHIANHEMHSKKFC